MPSLSNNKHPKQWQIFTNIIIVLFVLLCIWFVLKGSAFLSNIITTTTKSVWQQTTKIIANTIWKAMKQDKEWNINVLLVWYGGAKHQWWFLADSMIIASFDPHQYSISMISIPRDLVINSSGYINRINTVMAYSYNKTKDLDMAVKALSTKLTEITSIETPYYALVDFNWFSELIDKIWGIDVYVPRKVYDTTYPGPNYSYTTFSINSGQQHLDWSTALKYARSRHSSSDFSRSQRQQLILKSLLSKLTQQWLSIDTIKNLYSLYNEYVHSNITLDEMLWLLAYGKTIPTIHSFWITMECSNNIRKSMQAWCFLYPVDSSQFWGMSWLLPVWADIWKISYYDPIRSFSEIVAHNQWYLNESWAVRIYNAIDKAYAKKFSYKDEIANKLWSKLKRFGFNIIGVDNAPKSSSGTIAIITGTGDYKKTIETLRLFFPINEVEINPATVDLSGNTLPNTIDIYIWNTFLDIFWNKPFNFYLPYAQ